MHPSPTTNTRRRINGAGTASGGALVASVAWGSSSRSSSFQPSSPVSSTPCLAIAIIMIPVRRRPRHHPLRLRRRRPAPRPPPALPLPAHHPRPHRHRLKLRSQAPIRPLTRRNRPRPARRMSRRPPRQSPPKFPMRQPPLHQQHPRPPRSPRLRLRHKRRTAPAPRPERPVPLPSTPDSQGTAPNWIATGTESPAKLRSRDGSSAERLRLFSRNTKPPRHDARGLRRVVFSEVLGAGCDVVGAIRRRKFCGD